MRWSVLSPLSFALAAACATPPASPPNHPVRAEPVFAIRGHLVTMDPSRPHAEIAVVEHGRFTCVGDRASCKLPEGTRVLDLGAGSAVPGLADAHGHVASLGRAEKSVRLEGGKSESECVDRIAERAKTTPKGAWIIARGWDQTRFPGARFPTAAELSRRVPDHPVLAARIDGHAVWVNARALALAGIGRSTPNPAGGEIVRGDDGNPTGVLIDNAEALIASKVPPLTDDEVKDAVLAASRKLVALGFTSVHDAGVDGQTLRVYRKLAEEDRLPLRIVAMIDGDVSRSRAELAALMSEWRGRREIGRLAVPSVKLFADGALGSRGALLWEPYTDDPKTSGLAVTPKEELKERISMVVNAGFQPAVHAIGDRAVAEVLEAFVELRKPELRPRVEHLQILAPRDEHLLRGSGVVASMQPVHATSDGPWAETRLGHDTPRQKGAYAWRTILRAGVVLACGSDFPVEDPDPRAGLFAAETRSWPGGPSPASGGWMPEQRLTREEALACFTTGAAWASFAETRRGKIAVGYDADLTAFDRDVLAVKADELPHLKVTHTLVGGRIEHGGPTAAP